MLGVGIGIGVNRFRAGSSYPAVLDDGNTVLWVDSAENITKDGSDLVSAWGDKSGLDHHLLQATPTNQPLWTSDGVLFDGVDNFMKTAAFTLIQPEFIYMVFRQTTFTDPDYIFDGNANASGLLRQDDPSPSLLAYGGANSGLNSDLQLNTFGIVRVLFNGSSSKLQVNSTTAISGDFGTVNMGGFTLAARGTGTSFQSNIEVKEIIIRKVADIAGDESDIYDYLKEKYSVI